jgi:hypothetical protein
MIHDIVEVRYIIPKLTNWILKLAAEASPNPDRAQHVTQERESGIEIPKKKTGTW